MKLVQYKTYWISIVDADGLVLQCQVICIHNTLHIIPSCEKHTFRMLICPVMKRQSVWLLQSNYGFSHFHNEFLRYTPKPMKVTNGISYVISKTCPYSAFIKFKCFYRILYWQYIEDYIRNHSVYAPSQWEMALQCNAISHWLGAYTEWSLLHTI